MAIQVPKGYGAPQLMTSPSAGFLEYDIRYQSPAGHPPLEATGHLFALSVYPARGLTPPDFVAHDLDATLKALTATYAKPPLQVIISRHVQIAGRDGIEVRLLDPFGDLKQEAMLIDGEGRLITIDGLQEFSQVPRAVQEAAFDELVSTLTIFDEAPS